MSGGLPTKPKPKSTPTATPTATPTSTPSKPAENGGGGATIEQLETDIKVALEKEEYETAASLKKKLLPLKEQADKLDADIKIALEKEDYETAASLKKKLLAIRGK